MNYLVDKHGRVAHDRDVKVMFGLGEKAKWPVEGMPARNIQGIKCWIRPVLVLYQNRGLRAMGECPVCKKEMPIGRLAQHAKVHPDFKDAA